MSAGGVSNHPHGPRAPERTGVRTGASRGRPVVVVVPKVPQAFRILALERITQAVAPHDERGRVVVAVLPRLERNTRADLLAAHRATRSDVTADAEADDRFVVAASTRSGRRRKGARRPTRSRGLGATRTLE